MNIERKFVNVIENSSTAFNTDEGWRGKALVLVGASGLPSSQENWPRLNQGTGANDRIGQKFTIASIQLDIHVRNVATEIQSTMTAGGTPTLVNMWNGMRVELCLVMDRATQGTNASNADVFDDIYNIAGNLNMENRKRFKKVKQWTVHLNPPTGLTAVQKLTSDIIQCRWVGSECKTIKWYQKMALPIIENGSTNNLDGMRYNSLKLWVKVLGGQVNASLPEDPIDVTVDVNGRIRYTDA